LQFDTTLFDCRFVLIDGKNPPTRQGALQQFPRMAARSEGRVDVASIRTEIEKLHDFVQ
jgi:hypothetical protein